jgi:acid phosphatase type 7
MTCISRQLRWASLFAAVALCAYCAKDSLPGAPTPPTGAPTASTGAPAPPVGPTGVLVGAGDIGFCGTPGAEATARLLDRLAGTVFTAGDNAYVTGTRAEFQNCYAPTWGRHLSRTRPVAGNHEYGSGASGYFEYFGASAGPSGAGFYSYTVGPWSVVALNSEIPVAPGSEQMMWLRNELSSRRAPCTAVIWHRPLFSSGRHGDNPDMRDVWRTLYEYDVDVVINGHDHSYERFAPQDPDGRYDPARGIREFVVGTGGAPVYEFSNLRPNSEVRASVWGIASFTLGNGAYQWEFVPVDGESFRDAGAGSCH